MTNIYNKIVLFFKSEDKRSKKAYKNIAGLFGVRGLNIVIGFVQVPLVLNYLDPERYGIWITLTVILGWFSLFDIGLGNGLRNRLAEAIARKELSKAKIYVSTTYAVVFLIFSALFLVFLVGNQFLDWSRLLNTTPGLAGELRVLAMVVFFFFSGRFIVSIIESIAKANQEPAFANLINTSGRLAALVGIWFLVSFAESRLLYLGIVLAGIPVVVTTLISIWAFTFKYKDYRPSLSHIQFSEFGFLMNLGFKFFFLQLSGIIFFQTNSFIIAQIFGPEEVTPYSIGFKYYSVVTMLFTIVLAPYWSAITDAYTKGELDWIQNTVRRLRMIWGGFLIILIVMLALSGHIIELWVGDEVRVSAGLSIALAFYTAIFSYNAIYSHFINGTGKLKVQLYRMAVSIVLYIPVTIYFAKTFGLTGIMFGLILVAVTATIIYEIQYHKVIHGKATGIWDG